MVKFSIYLNRRVFVMRYSLFKLLIFTLRKHTYSNILNFTAEAVLTNTNNLCFLAEIRQIMYTPCKPYFYYTKAGFKGVRIMYVNFRDANNPAT